MFQVYNWPNVILHMDADAFFASVIQSIYPTLKGKPVIVGKERGLATAFSYEAKRRGVRRGMLSNEIKKICPDAIFVDSDFEAFGLYSRKMFQIARTFSPEVEEYSVDEGFLDIKGLRRPLHMTYEEIGLALQSKIKSHLDITVSIGISITKSLAKLASGAKKPSGLVMVPGKNITQFLRSVPIRDVWGIGENTAAYLKKFNIRTALDFASKPESFFVSGKLSRPYREIWHELRGEKIYEINPRDKDSYQSISRTHTFDHTERDAKALQAKILYHIEQAFEKARSLRYVAGRVHIFLKTQQFTYHSTEIKLPEKLNYPLLMRKEILEGFKRIYKKGVDYRAAGCTISDFQDASVVQQSLFAVDGTKEKKIQKIYDLFEKRKVDFGSKLFDQERMQKKKKINLSIPLYNLS